MQGVGADEARVRPPDVAGNGLWAAADGGSGQKGGGGRGLVLLVASVMVAGGETPRRKR